MAKKSAGILVYTRMMGSLRIFLVHPGGPYYAKKDPGAWTIPKGEFDDLEDPLVAAKREFKEETGLSLTGEFLPLTPFKQKSGKIIFAWAHETAFEAADIKSNTFEMEWPPRSGKKATFPEVDRGAWYTVEEALEKILEAQKVIIVELTTMISGQ